ncbi:MAG: hypothetical protein N3E36_02135 [Sulfolobales archaeon]|nr:hypothetical protein [Sulfolobales archaeon]MCX8198812.1 hypothetical protein [Sulfolobales archaeon]MDW8170790.1 hypothetical protein [Desulfurococcaceae archaeon]
MEWLELSDEDYKIIDSYNELSMGLKNIAEILGELRISRTSFYRKLRNLSKYFRKVVDIDLNAIGVSPIYVIAEAKAYKYLKLDNYPMTRLIDSYLSICNESYSILSYITTAKRGEHLVESFEEKAGNGIAVEAIQLANCIKPIVFLNSWSVLIPSSLSAEKPSELDQYDLAIVAHLIREASSLSTIALRESMPLSTTYYHYWAHIKSCVRAKAMVPRTKTNVIIEALITNKDYSINDLVKDLASREAIVKKACSTAHHPLEVVLEIWTNSVDRLIASLIKISNRRAISGVKLYPVLQIK